MFTCVLSKSTAFKWLVVFVDLKLSYYNESSSNLFENIISIDM